jgi:transposase-like protein
MMAERGIVVSYSTILRWVSRYVPEFEKRWNRFARPVNTSWRVDETYIKVRGKWNYLYCAVDKHGKTVDFLLRPDRGIAAAQAFFRKALSTSLPKWPRKITLDGQVPSHIALRLLRREDPKWKDVEVRSNQYLNNLIEQDHRAIKSDAPRWWEASSPSGVRPLPWPVSNLPIGYARDNSRSVVVDIKTSGH